MVGFPVAAHVFAAAHLDPDRRSALFSKLDSLGGQVFMTGTDEALFEALPANAEVFEIREHQGRLLKRGEAP